MPQVEQFPIDCHLNMCPCTTNQIFKGEVDLNRSEFFLRPPRAGLRGHTYRLLQGPSRLRRRSGAFSVRIVAVIGTLLSVPFEVGSQVINRESCSSFHKPGILPTKRSSLTPLSWPPIRMAAVNTAVAILLNFYKSGDDAIKIRAIVVS